MPATSVTEAATHSDTKTTVEAAILKTVAYGDVFDYPLTGTEISYYLAGVAAPLETVAASLSNGRLVPRYLSRYQDYFTLPGRESLVPTRRQREAVAQRLWPEAIFYGQLIANLPFIRMIAITGSLAVNNVEPGADIDYLIVTEPGRLWLARALTILVVRLAAQRGVTLCPNYFLSQRALVFTERNLYTAHELVQMRPLDGLDVYHHLRRLNRWTADFLPNAQFQPPATDIRATAGPMYGWQFFAEASLRTPAGTFIERWEMRRKIRKFSHVQDTQNGRGPGEAAFSADWCKGHFEGHGQRILESFARRVQMIGE